MPNWIGDFVMATPVLSHLRKKFPEAEIVAMCRGVSGQLLEKDADVDEVFQFKKEKWISRHEEQRNVVKSIQQGEYDLGVLLPNSFSSAWFFFRGNVKHRLGYKGHKRQLLLTHPLNPPKKIKSQHLVHTYQMILEPLGIDQFSLPPRLYICNSEIGSAKNLVKKLGYKEGMKLVGINPGAAYGSAKCWLPDRFREVVNQLLEDPNVFILFFGDSGGAPLVEEIIQDISPRVVSLAGKTSLRALSSLISICDVLLTNDSGPMHIAAALNTPLVALFGSTSDVATGPYGSEGVIHKHVSCSPCYLRTCPIDFRCMKEISVDEVVNALRKKLKSAR